MIEDFVFKNFQWNVSNFQPNEIHGERLLSGVYVLKMSSSYLKMTEYCHIPRYSRGNLHFRIFQILSDLERSKRVLWLFLRCEWKLTLNMYHTCKIRTISTPTICLDLVTFNDIDLTCVHNLSTIHVIWHLFSTLATINKAVPCQNALQCTAKTHTPRLNSENIAACYSRARHLFPPESDALCITPPNRLFCPIFPNIHTTRG